MLTLSIHQDIADQLPDLHIGLLHYHDVKVSDSPQMLKGRMQLYEENLRIEHTLETMKEHPQIHYYRTCFRSLGIDPAKYRPSSEALLRRVLQGKNLSSIHSAADLNNFFSLRYIVPCGLYDLDKLEGRQLTMRLGDEGESYLSLAGRETSATGKWITADEIGPFGSPVVDAERSKVTPNSRNLLHIIYLPNSIQNKEDGKKLLSTFAEMFLHIHGGELGQSEVVSATS